MESYAASLMDEAGPWVQRGVMALLGALRLKESMAESGEYAHLAAEGDFRRVLGKAKVLAAASDACCFNRCWNVKHLTSDRLE